ncbi:hypothetical protein N658DRAFT_505735 [Parathielavia hyrcaniae]|uniref:Fungal N-terminal domain-containing protein n=1 Tax=Parathielavia hyrcaniae TaxID=113614 RepID=A0AAN6T3F3_9PEZI|nr:hypothetical protein N658DRAFT_505735 [Parathielavia hyrcaniae]
MADPLSIAASVVGLLTTAGRICSVLSNFIGAAADAPKSAQDALSAVDEVRSVLAMVEGLLATISNLSSRRKMLVRLDHIRITFTNCVLTLSELESLAYLKFSHVMVLHITSKDSGTTGFSGKPPRI